jgi:hypothetical protein
MSVRAVMWIILLQEKGALPPQYWDALKNDLICHPTAWNTIDTKHEMSQEAAVIKRKTKASMSVETTLKIFWMMRLNSIVLPTSVPGGIGMMLDPLFAKTNHRCDANAMPYPPAHTSTTGWCQIFASVIPRRDIKAGEQITIFYSDPAAPLKDRNPKHKFYCFQCSCPLCKKDQDTETDILLSQPGLCVEFKSWSNDILTMLEHVQTGEYSRAEYDDASKIFDDRFSRYMEHPDLYQASHLEQIIIHLIYNGLKLGAFDKALINGLRVCFLIYPARIPGRHNASVLHVLFIVLEAFDILLGVNVTDDTLDIDPDQVRESFRIISRRRLSGETLIYWRQQICKDLEKRLEGTAARDLIALVQTLQAHLPTEDVQDITGKAATKEICECIEKHAQVAMRKVLQIPESSWKMVVKKSDI